ncbi:MAG: hypothetical protein OEV08_10495 [Nitrospira sp.]|nr:hypothetical protein [Nitrospira sp.]
MSDQRLSMREQLEANYDSVGGGEGGSSVREEASEVVRSGPGERSGGQTEISLNKVGDAVRADSFIETRKDKKPEAPEQKVEQKADDKAVARDEKGKFTAKKYPGQWKQDLAPLWEKPGGHTAEEWAKFQEEALRREMVYSTDQSNWQKRLNEMEPVYKGITQVFEPYKDTFARRGIEPVAVMKQLLALSEYADRDPVGFLTEQARMRGLDLASLVQQQQDSGQPVDPKVAALETELRQIKAVIQATQNQTQVQQQQSVTKQVQTFQTATNEDGSPKHPHFDRVRLKMGSLMTADQDLSMEDAYRDACYADPEVRESILADEWTRRNAKHAEDLKRASDAAKSQRGGSSGRFAGQSLPKGSSIRAQLEANYDRLNGDARVQ